MPNIDEAAPRPPPGWAHHCGLLPGLGMEAVMWALLSSSPSDLLTRSAMEGPAWIDPAPTGKSGVCVKSWGCGVVVVGMHWGLLGWC